MPASIVIVADDLTGAADCGIACTAAGLNTLVVFGEISRALDLAADAIAFDADTRRQLPAAARAATELAVRHRRTRVSRHRTHDPQRANVSPGQTARRK